MLIAGRVLAVSLLLFSFAAAQAATTYYVAPGASGSGATIDDPSGSIQSVVDLAQAGDTIWLRGGIYDLSSSIYQNPYITFRNPGTASAWITIASYPGEHAHIITPQTTQPTLYFYRTGPCTDSATNTVDYTSGCYNIYWKVQDLEISGGYYSVQMDAASVKLINNDLHGSLHDLVKMTAYADHVEIRGNKIHDNNTVNSTDCYWNAQGLDMVGVDDVVVADNQLYDLNDFAIVPKGQSSRVIIENNSIQFKPKRVCDDPAQGYMETGGIGLGGNTDPDRFRDPSADLHESIDNRVRNNIIYASTGPCIVISSAIGAEIYNNTCYQSASDFQGALYFTNQDSVYQLSNQNISIYNNVFHLAGARAAHIASGTSPGDVHMDNNLYWSASAGGNIVFDADAFGLYGLSFSQWQAQTGQDANSLLANPVFADTNLLTIDSSSPAVDAGTGSLCAADDYGHVHARPQDGNGDGTATCDIGAYEVSDSTAPVGPIAIVSATPTTGNAPLLVNFDGSQSTPSAGASIASYTWNFGDGTTGSGAVTSHTYGAAGSYIATLTVADSANRTSPASQTTITVTTTGPTTRWENNDSRLNYAPLDGQWSLNGSDPNFSGGNFAVANSTGATLTFSFTGTAIKWISTLDGYSGQARVTLDGVATVVDLYRAPGAPDFGYQQIAWQASGLANTTHTVEIYALGTKNANSGDTAFYIDAFDISSDTSQAPPPSARWENNDARLAYAPLDGQWSLNGSDPNFSGGNFAVANSAGATLTFNFTGTGIKWIATLDGYSGQARVTLDGVSTTVDLYRAPGAPDFGYQQVAWQAAGLANTTHTVEIYALGTKNANSGDTAFYVDAFDITGQ